MKCLNHPESDATGYCRQCGKALCAACRRDVRGVSYCEDCLAATVLGGGAPAAPGAPNPGAALALGFIPGVGAIYNGEYGKALLFILIFGGLISALSTGAARGLEPLLGILLGAFILWMPFEAYHTAKRRAAGQAAASPSWGGLGFGDGGRATPLGPVILIVLGVIFLLNTLHIFRLHWLRDFWPLILIALGVWMLWKRTGGDSRGESQ